MPDLINWGMLREPINWLAVIAGNRTAGIDVAACYSIAFRPQYKRMPVASQWIEQT
jgi:hypothetical protein